jgi:hypothetical protein
MFIVKKKQSPCAWRNQSRFSSLFTLICVLVLPTPTYIQPAHARNTPTWTDFNTHDPGIVLFVGGSAEQRIVLLIGNPDVAVPPCHFSGVVRVDDSPPPFGSGLKDLVFEPLSLAPGESRALDIPFMPDPDAGTRQELILRVENDKPGRGPCPLLVQVIGYDSSSGATEFVIDRFAAGFEKTFAPADPMKSQLPLGFVGGNVQQVGRFLISENNSPRPAARCDFTGEVIAETVPRLDSADSAVSGHVMQKAWPITWEGTDLKRAALVEIPFAEFGATPDRRVEVLLSLRLKRPVPAACFGGLVGSLQIVDLTGKTRAVIPADRVFFNFNHFNNVPLI